MNYPYVIERFKLWIYLTGAALFGVVVGGQLRRWRRR